jgi:hypothetical protein
VRGWWGEGLTGGQQDGYLLAAFGQIELSFCRCALPL